MFNVIGIAVFYCFRKRAKAFNNRRKQANATTRTTRTSQNTSIADGGPTPRKRPKDMTEEERREHNRLLRQESRRRETPKKSWWHRKKDNERKKEKRAAKKAEEAPAQPSTSTTCSPFKKSEYNAIWRMRKFLLKKKPEKSAQLLKNLSKTKDEERRAALKKCGIFLTKDEVKAARMKILKTTIKALKSRFRSKRKRRRDALSEVVKAKVRRFCLREDISRVLPHKRYATKHGPGHVLQHTLRQAYTLFRKEYPEVKLGYTLFTRLRPKNVRLISSRFLDTCQCVCCLNVRLKLLAVNRLISKTPSLPSDLRVEDENALYNKLMCAKGENKFHKPDCIQRECRNCSQRKEALQRHFQPLLSANLGKLSWSRWTRGDGGREPIVQTDTIQVLLDELIQDVVAPYKSTTFIQHLFTAFWQHDQYHLLKKQLKVGQVLVVMDFAENKKTMVQDEIKSAHFNKKQFSLHPVIAFYRPEEGSKLTRHAIDFVSDDVKHDFHSVHHFTAHTINLLRERGILHNGSEFFIFSDNCAAQYKCRGNFADLSHYTEPVQRIYYGAEHGKGKISMVL